MTTIIFRAYDMWLEDLPSFDPTPIYDFIRAALARVEQRLGRKIVAVGRLEFKGSRDASGRERALAGFHLAIAGADADEILEELKPPKVATDCPYRPVASKPLVNVGGVTYVIKGRYEGIRSKTAYKSSCAGPSKPQKINIDLYHSRFRIGDTILRWRIERMISSL